MKILAVGCIVLSALFSTAAYSRGGGSGSHHSGSMAGGAFGTQPTAPGTNSAGTALSGGGASFVGMAFVLTSLHHWFVHPERQASLLLVPLGLTSILIGFALLLATSAVYVFGRNRIRTSSDGFSSAPEPG